MEVCHVVRDYHIGRTEHDRNVLIEPAQRYVGKGSTEQGWQIIQVLIM